MINRKRYIGGTQVNKRYLGSTVLFDNSAVGYDTDAQAFIDAVGTLTTVQEIAIDDLVTGLKANGTWTKYHAIYPFIGGTASAHKWNLKDPRDLDAAFRITWNGTVTHDETGITGDLSTGYGDTHLKLLSVIGNSLNIGFGAYVRNSDVFNSKIIMGSNNSISGEARNVLETNNGYIIRSNGYSDAAISPFISSGNYPVYAFGQRTSLSEVLITVNDNPSFKVTNTATITPNNQNDYSIYLLGLNQAGTLNSPTNANISLAVICDTLTATDITNDYTVFSAFQTSLSRNV
jgi:hypothetical protein